MPYFRVLTSTGHPKFVLVDVYKPFEAKKLSSETQSPDYPEPLIIPRKDHPISRSNLDREALKVLYRLRDAGFTACLVGGGVRDLYLDKTPKDFDISTNARPGQLRKLFRNSRTIGRRFRLVQVFFHGNKIIEVSTFRCRSEFDINGKDKVLAANNTFGSLADDAFRRDLTINALFYEVENFTIIDYVGGVADLNNRIVRIVGDADRRITRDPVRMMRALRHASRTGFTIEEKTWQAIVDHRETLKVCPVSRIRDELFKDLHGTSIQAWARLAIDSGLFFVIFPFYENIISSRENEKTSLLLSLFGVMDRLQKEGYKIPDHLLLALLLIPWVQHTFPLMQEKITGKEAYAMSRDIKTALDKNLPHLNIKRADKEHIAGLLANLSLFASLYKTGKWPRWLTRKSYFKEGSQFYRIFREASGGKPVTALKLDQKTVKTKSRKRGSRSTGCKVASAPNTKGGIFGFKK